MLHTKESGSKSFGAQLFICCRAQSHWEARLSLSRCSPFAREGVEVAAQFTQAEYEMFGAFQVLMLRVCAPVCVLSEHTACGEDEQIAYTLEPSLFIGACLAVFRRFHVTALACHTEKAP